MIGTGAGIFERIQSELSGYYLLGVESGPTDKDGKAHPIRVDVSRRGAHGPRAPRAADAARDAQAAERRAKRMLAALANSAAALGAAASRGDLLAAGAGSRKRCSS